jgi:phosphate transport system substrate-binding protein
VSAQPVGCRRQCSVVSCRLRRWLGRRLSAHGFIALLGVLTFCCGIPCAASETIGDTLDRQLPTYRETAGVSGTLVSGTLSSVGSDTLADIMTLWAQAFNRLYPNVNIQIQASGSSTAPKALTQASADFGPMSRQMNRDELQAFIGRHGYPPTPVLVALDALAIYVSQDNPLPGLSLRQVDAIFSRSRKCGANQDIAYWGQLGLAGRWLGRDIRMFGRNSASGSYGYFKRRVLCAGDFKNNVNELPGSAAVVRAVSDSVNALGYAGMRYRGAGVRVVPISESGRDYVEATPQNVLSGSYPLSRYLYIYVNKVPQTPLPTVHGEFLSWVLSRAGQQLLLQDGYMPLPVAVVAQQRRKLQL